MSAHARPRSAHVSTSTFPRAVNVRPGDELGRLRMQVEMQALWLRLIQIVIEVCPEVLGP